MTKKRVGCVVNVIRMQIFSNMQSDVGLRWAGLQSEWQQNRWHRFLLAGLQHGTGVV